MLFEHLGRDQIRERLAAGQLGIAEQCLCRTGEHTEALLNDAGDKPIQLHLWLEKEGNRVNGKCIMGVLLLEAESGAPVTVEVDGPDEDKLLADLRQLFMDRFHEE